MGHEFQFLLLITDPSSVDFPPTFVGTLHILFLKHEVVALHCSRVELQPEDDVPLGGATLMIAFDLQVEGGGEHTGLFMFMFTPTESMYIIFSSRT